jgi:hypothetical protein
MPGILYYQRVNKKRRKCFPHLAYFVRALSQNREHLTVEFSCGVS